MLSLGSGRNGREDLSQRMSRLAGEVAGLKQALEKGARKRAPSLDATRDLYSDIYHELRERIEAAKPVVRSGGRRIKRTTKDNLPVIVAGAVVLGLGALLFSRNR